MGRRWVTPLWVAGLVGLVSYLAYQTKQVEREAELLALPSSYRWSPSGTAAFYTLLARLGYPVVRWHRSYRHLKGKQGLLIALEPGADPRFSVSPLEREALEEWLREGNACLLAPPSWGTGGILGEELREVEVPPKAGLLRPRPPLHGIFAGQPLLRHPLASPLPLFEGVREVVWVAMPSPAAGKALAPSLPRLAFPTEATEGIPLWADEHGVLVLEKRFGAGRALLLAGATPLSNDLLGRGENARWGVRLVQGLWSGKGEVLFDEYHHGYREQRTVLWWLLRPERRPLLVQGVLLMALGLLMASLRFGRAVPSPSLPRHRPSLEHLEALAILYRRARAYEQVARMLLQALRGRLARAVGLSPALPWETLAQAAASCRPVSPEEMVGLAREMEEKAPAADPPALLRWSREMERLLRVVERRGSSFR